MRKPAFCICENKDADQLRGNRVISAFVYATRIVQSLFFLNPKFQGPSHLLWVYSPASVGPGRKSRRPVFSQRGLKVRNALMKLFVITADLFEFSPLYWIFRHFHQIQTCKF